MSRPGARGTRARRGPPAAVLALLAAATGSGCGGGGAEVAPPPPRAEASPPGRSLAVRVTGGEFRWEFLYPGPDGILGSPDDLRAQGDLHLPAHSRVRVDLRSEDYVYLFYVPDLNVMEAAVPESPFEAGFDTDAPGSFRLMGSQMCGYAHPGLLGEVIVQPPGEFDAWLVSAARSVGSGEALLDPEDPERLPLGARKVDP